MPEQAEERRQQSLKDYDKSRAQKKDSKDKDPKAKDSQAPSPNLPDDPSRKKRRQG